MKIVIDISPEELEMIKLKLNSPIGGVISQAELIILNGTPLPKGHGRLIDADELKKYKYHDENRYENAVAIAQVDWMPTILEADKEVDQ